MAYLGNTFDTTSTIIPRSVVIQKFASDGTNATFALPIGVEAENIIQVFNNGVYQEQGSYQISGQNLVFIDAPFAGFVEVIVNQSVVSVWAAGQTSFATYTATAGQTVFALPATPASSTAVEVYINGIMQARTAFTVLASNVTLSEGAEVGSTVEVKVTWQL